ncbi:MAG: acyltransferase [Tidjanibacter sp.]|nr:acyltransferase [Tidjanibacter sp.]
MRVIKLVCLVLYYCFARFLPTSYTPIVGKPSKWIRYQLCRNIFAKCGKNVNIERGAFFGRGSLIEIGDNSGMGVNCHLPSNTKIGNNVMMAPNCYILNMNHAFDRTDIPMCQQGSTPPLTTIIEDDVWIGRGVMMTPGRVVKRGSVVAAGCVLCKDFPEYSIVGGNPSRFIKSRL